MRLTALAGAFVRSVRQEGVGMASRKVGRYLRLRSPQARRADARYLEPAWRTMADAGTFFPSVPARRIFSQPRIALIGDLGLPQCKKYRVDQVVELCGLLGVDVTISHYLDVPRSVRILQDATHLFEYRLPLDDLCLQYRYEARRLGLPILYDIDDPLFSFPAYATYSNMKGVDADLHARFLRDTSRYLAMMNGADVLSVSTPALRDHLAQMTARPVHVRRNFADRDTLAAGRAVMQRTPAREGAPFTLSFASGSLGHEHDFAVAADPIHAFLRRHPDTRLRILGRFPESAVPADLRARTVFDPFTDYDAYLGHLAQSDCMVMPLAPELFNRCKSAVRAIDAASVGVPALASDVGDNACLVRTGETGFLIGDEDEWTSALEALYHDRALARRLGLAARETLERDWGASEAGHVIAPELAAWLRG